MKHIIIAIGMTLSNMLLFGQTNKEYPTIGQTNKVTYTVCRIDVGWNGSQNINNVYAAPRGWQILEFRPLEISRRQRVSYTFDQTPSNFSISTTSIVDAKFNELLELATELGKKEKYEGRINQMRNDYEKFYKKIISTHSQITTTGSVRGDNNRINRRPGRLYLDLEITLVYYPDSEEQFLSLIEVTKSIIKNDE